MRKLLLVLAFFLGGCEPYHQTARKITQGDRVWMSCDVTLGVGWARFTDQQTGKTVVLYGTMTIEQTDIPCPAQ